MNRICRTISVFSNCCGCRFLTTSAATQLKPKQTNQTIPSPKSWDLPLKEQSPKISSTDFPTKKDWSRPTQVSSQVTGGSSSSSAKKWSPPSPLKGSLSPGEPSRSLNKQPAPYKTTQHDSPAAQSHLQEAQAFSATRSQLSHMGKPKTQSNSKSSSQNPTAKLTSTQGRIPNKGPGTMRAKPGLGHKRARRRDVFIPSTLTVATLAGIMRLKLDYFLSRMRRIGMVDEASYDYILNADYAALLADEMGFNPIIDDEAAFDIHPPPPHPDPSSLPPRPPIVTIMGHVDHGKTTLLDTLRSASVAKSEAGGITQHIGAFSVPVKTAQSADATDTSQTITFLDTPGHAAFSAMRARGADVTDIIVLVVAADDGIMPQTREIINLLKKEGADKSLVVAINKVDKPSVDIDAVKKGLMAEGIQLEDFGGDIPAVPVSGLTGQGLPDLIEIISAVAELQDLRAEKDGSVVGYVLESHVDKGLGNVATVLVKRGALKRGSLVISGLSHGKVRTMTDSKGLTYDKALPGMAVTTSGWKTLPKAGDEVLEGSDADIKNALSNRARKAEMDAMQQDIEVINTTRRQERDARVEGNKEPSYSEEAPAGPKQVKIFIKADVSGSGEALQGALDGMGNDLAQSKVLATSVGDVSESDVMRAHAANATIIAFSVSVPRAVHALANRLRVPILPSNIIYRTIEDVRSSLISLLPPIIETKVLGEADVLQVFDIHLKGGKTMKVAGCRVTNGMVEKQKSARVIRAGEVIHEGFLETLRQLSKDITEARKGVECGMSLKDFSDFRSGDMIQIYDSIEKPGKL